MSWVQIYTDLNDWYYSQKSGPSTLDMLATSTHNSISNTAVAALATSASTGCYLWASALLNHCIKPLPGSIKDYAINAFSFLASAYAGCYVAEKVGSSPVPLLENSGLGIDTGWWLGISGAIGASTLAAVLHLNREEALAAKKSKK